MSCSLGLSLSVMCRLFYWRGRYEKENKVQPGSWIKGKGEDLEGFFSYVLFPISTFTRLNYIILSNLSYLTLNSIWTWHLNDC